MLPWASQCILVGPHSKPYALEVKADNTSINAACTYCRLPCFLTAPQIGTRAQLVHRVRPTHQLHASQDKKAGTSCLPARTLAPEALYPCSTNSVLHSMPVHLLFRATLKAAGRKKSWRADTAGCHKAAVSESARSMTTYVATTTDTTYCCTRGPGCPVSNHTTCILHG